MGSILSYPGTTPQVALDLEIDLAQGQTGQPGTKSIKNTYRVPASELVAFIQYAVGTPQSYGPPGSQVINTIPANHEIFTLFYVQSLNAKLIPAPHSISTCLTPYQLGEVSVVFSPFPFGTTGPDAFRTVNISIAGNFITTPGSVYTFTTGGVSAGEVGLFLPEMTIEVTRYQVPQFDVAGMLALEGHVNTSAFQCYNASLAAGTVLMAGATSQIDQSLIGQNLWQVSYTLSYKPQTWNALMHPNGTSGFVPIQDQAGNPPYASADFSSLQ